MSETTERFRKVEIEMLKDMKERRDLLDSAITSLEYRLSHPSPPPDWNEINTFLEKEREWWREYHKKEE